MKLFLNKIIDEIGELLTPPADQIQDSESQNPAGSDGVIKTESTKPEDKEIVEFQKTLSDSRTLDEKISDERFDEIQRLKSEVERLEKKAQFNEDEFFRMRDLKFEVEKEVERLKIENTAIKAFLIELTDGSPYLEKKVQILFDQIKSTIQNSGQ